MFRSDDGGRAWRPLRPPLVRVTAAVYDRRHPDRLWLGSESAVASLDGAVFRSDDGGAFMRVRGGLAPVVLAPAVGGGVWADAIGGAVVHLNGDGRVRRRIAPARQLFWSPVALAVDPSGRAMLASTGAGVWSQRLR
jgi:hypothetical protein